ncbi:chemotaxis protein CheA [Marinobacter sp. NSM]|uniref:chemotaxis protein CheA n=1 Tax=Marinobacter sp. NSM TaxID=3458004 RepID=UPI0040373D0E
MSIDLEQFHGVFFEESVEHIDNMEHMLMALDLEQSQPDPEDINSIFRAAHSIKGGSGTFGFTALTDVTHVMENLLDQARKRERVLTPELVDSLLSGVDVLRDLVSSYRSKTQIDNESVRDSILSFEKILQGPVNVSESETSSDNENQEAYGFFDDIPALEPASDPSENITVQSVDKSSVAQKPVKNTAAHESSTIRVDTDKVDGLINLVGELVITQSMLKVLSDDPVALDASKMTAVLDELERNTREIQESVMSIRMIPVSLVFNRFPRVVRDLASKMEKEVDLVLDGAHTELDKSLIEQLVDPLTHLVRNSIDHGIETPDVRLAKGKPSRGQIKISASQSGGNILIAISDDGAGLSKNRILAKARENNLLFNEDASDQDIWNLIFQPGFSTAEQVTDVSGRGVGMDVVRRNIQKLGGRVEIASVEGVGSTFTIQLPLTLAIVDGMGVSVGDQTFIIPLVSIVESMQPPKDSLRSLAGSYLLHVREEFWPLLPLHEVMDTPPKHLDPSNGIVVLVETSKRRYGLLVDDLVGQQQVVIKSLEQHYRRVPGTSGATIMGDGSVALILDVESLADAIKIPAEESL